MYALVPGIDDFDRWYNGECKQFIHAYVHELHPPGKKFYVDAEEGMICNEHVLPMVGIH